jgi:uncharacterized membrane protein YfcA
MPLEITYLLLIAMSIVAGFVGAILGLGGGIILVPGLTILFGFPMKSAVAASLVSVIATSSAAATVYVQERFSNIKLGMLLEITTTLGALAGGLIANYIGVRYLFFLFAVMLVYSASAMIRQQHAGLRVEDVETKTSELDGEYFDPALGKTVSYMVDNVPLGMVGSLGAGLISALLGVGGGIIKVPLMNVTMKIPMKAAVATSNFMIGVTAATGALVYWANGRIDAKITAPCVIGVLIGARIGTKVTGRIKTKKLKLAFVVVLIITAIQMAMKGLRA